MKKNAREENPKRGWKESLHRVKEIKKKLYIKTEERPRESVKKVAIFFLG